MTEEIVKQKKSKVHRDISQDDYNLIVRDIANSVTIREGTTLDTTFRSDSWYKAVWVRLNENKFAMYSFYYTILMIAIGILFPALISSNPSSTDGVFTAAYGGGPNNYLSFRHPLGTDFVGRDLQNQVVAGTYTSMLVGVFSTIIFLVIGVPLGLAAGYYQDWIESVIMRVADLFLAVPFLLLVLLFIQLLNSPEAGILATIPVPIIILLVLGVFGWAGTTRLVNSTTKQVLNEEYIAAARTIGSSDYRIISKHILPNILAPIIVIGTIGVAGGILSEAGITFLGIGNLLDTISWGAVLASGTPRLILNPNQVIIPGFAVFLISMAINLLGDALRDALDPRLKK